MKLRYQAGLNLETNLGNKEDSFAYVIQSLVSFIYHADTGFFGTLDTYPLR